MTRRKFLAYLAATLAPLRAQMQRAKFVIFTAPSQNPALAGATLFVPRDDVPFSARLTLALGWQQQITHLCPEAICQPWWTLNGCGLAAATLPNRWETLRDALINLWEQTAEDVLTIHRARQGAAWELLRWQRDPFQWLLWHARLMAIRQPLTELDDAKPLQITADRLSQWTRSSPSRPPLLLLLTPQAGISDEPVRFPQIALRPLLGKSITIPSPTPSLCHALWWTVTEREPMAGMVLGQLLGGGTGGLWFQQMRGEKPLAYHAFAGWQLTPVGGELFLFASCLPTDLPAVRRQAHKLLTNLRQARFSDQDFQKAQRLTLLRYRQILADPIEHGMTLTAWLLAGQQVRDWLSLPQHLPTLSPDTFRRFCQRLPFTVTEVIALL